MDFFLKSTEDSVKRITLTHNQKKWRPIRNEVKEWVLGNWYKWVEEKLGVAMQEGPSAVMQEGGSVAREEELSEAVEVVMAEVEPPSDVNVD